MPNRDDARASRWASRVGPAIGLVLALVSGCDGKTGALPSAAPVTTADAGVSPPPAPADAVVDTPSSDILALAVEEMLQTYCGDCHSNADNGAGFAGGLDLASLIGTGLIVPGSSASSRLLARIVDGSMPPATPGQPSPPRLTIGDAAVMASFIDQLSISPPSSCEPLPFRGLDATYVALLADVQSLPADDRPFVRYLGIVEASDALLCGAALEQRRQALFKLVNSLSMTSSLQLPAAIDDAALLYRIDLRDFGWLRDIDLDDDGSVDHPDGWAALLPAAAPYAVPLAGPEASALASEAGTPVPYLPVSVFVRAASTGDVYRALLGVRANIYDMELDFGVDILDSLDDGELRRAAFHRTGPGSDVIVNRVSLAGLPQPAYWWLDVDEEVGASSIYDDPLDAYRGSWRQTIWSLPNGLLAYAMNLADGTPIVQVPRSCIGSCARPQDVHAVACMACHAVGLRPVRDDIRRFVEEFSTYFSRDTLNDVRTTYPSQAEFDTLVDADNARYQAALAQLGIAADAPDPVSRVYLDFERPLDLARAAAELGIPAAELMARLDSLPAPLAPLSTLGATIERAAFASGYEASLCALQARNRPLRCR